MLYWHVLSLLVSLVISVPLEPGQPGGPWTEEEIDTVRAKVKNHSSSFEPKICTVYYYISSVVEI
jgi:hypothetical protein